MWISALISIGLVGALLSGPVRAAGPKPQGISPHVQAAAALIKERPGTDREKALVLRVLEDNWYQFAYGKDPRSEYYRQTLKDPYVRRQFEWERQQALATPDGRRDAFQFNAQWVDQGNALLDLNRAPRLETKYLVDWAAADLRKREAPVREQGCVNRDYGGTWKCLEWKTWRVGTLHLSRDGQIISFTFRGEEYVTSFVPASLLR